MLVKFPTDNKYAILNAKSSSKHISSGTQINDFISVSSGGISYSAVVKYIGNYILYTLYHIHFVYTWANFN